MWELDFRNRLAAKMSSSDSLPMALAQRGVAMGYPPEGITLKEYLPEDVLEMLHPFWHPFQPESPLFYNIMALIYVVLGKSDRNFK